MSRPVILTIVIVVIGVIVISVLTRRSGSVLNSTRTGDSLSIEVRDNQSVIINNQRSNMKIESSAFKDGGLIPVKYTCDGDNINPPLTFSDIPEGTKNLVLIVYDQDAIVQGETKKYYIQSPDAGGPFVHWIIYMIHPTEPVVEENTRPQYQGLNSRGELNYYGPCPPDGEHRYIFKLYAVDELMPLFEQTPNKKTLESVMDGHILSEATLMARYDRER